jgi:tetratricopeptide (TPR) repeat protein
MSKSTSKYHVHLIYILLTVITFIAFEPIIHNGFISFDDDAYINCDNITSGLKLENVIGAFTNIHANNYHPLTSLSHMLDCQLYGTNPAGHHFTNLLFHIGNVLLLFTVLNRMTKRLWASAFVTVLFAIHPLHVESVAWASERKDVLSTFLWMLTMLAYIRYVKRPAMGHYLLTLVLFLLGLLSKPMLVTGPFVLLLLDYWPLNRFQNTRSSRLVLEKIPFLALSAVLSIVTFEVQQKTGLVKSLSHYLLSWRIQNALVSYIIYIEKMFWPTNLAIFYPHPQGNIPLWQVTGAILALTLITLLALWKLRQYPYVAMGWFWFLGTLVPVIGIFQVGLQARADRYTYIPYIGLFIIIAWGISEFSTRLRPRKAIFIFFAFVLLSALGIKTYIQTIYWHDNISLYKHAAAAVKDNWWAHYFLGKALASQGEFEEAIVQFKKTLEIDSQNAPAGYEMAKTFLDKGDVDQAVKLYRQMLPPLPDDLNEPRGVNMSRNDYSALKELYVNANINLATALVRQGKFVEAARRFKEALHIAPDAAAARKGLEDIEKRAGK